MCVCVCIYIYIFQLDDQAKEKLCLYLRVANSEYVSQQYRRSIEKWSGCYKADREFGYLQINVSSNAACAQGGSVYMIWARYKADESNTDWCKFYEESIYRLSKGQEDSAARLVESQPIGQKKLVAVHVQSLTQWLQDSYLHQLGITHESASWK